MSDETFSPVIALGQVRYALKSMERGDDQSQALPWMIRHVEAAREAFLPLAGIPDPLAFVEAARGMVEAAEIAVIALHTEGHAGTAGKLRRRIATFRAQLGDAALARGEGV